MWRVLVVCSLLIGCTKANPAASCADGTCIDHEFPFCDVDGTVGGVPGTCIAVTCMPEMFAGCRGADVALTCNATGDNYDATQCQLGCDSATNGCRLCQANQTVCANGVVATCDADGNQTTQTCPLGCFEDQPRCRDIEPSNHLVTYLDMVQAPQDLDLGSGAWTINATTGTITNGGMTLSPATFDVPSPLGGPPIRVFVVDNLYLGNVYIYASGSSIAVAFLASGDVSITGPVVVDGSAGGVTSGGCVGTKGYTATAQANGAYFYIGAGGGGSVGIGSSGGLVVDQNSGTAPSGGSANGTDDLQPLVGGCAGGGFNNTIIPQTEPYGGLGGGALQISSRKSITIHGTLSAKGSVGYDNHPGAPGELTITGGGGGGGILLEAPRVELAAGATLSAAGGDGHGCTPMTQTCGVPGNGGHGTAAPTAGGSISFVSALGSTAEFEAGTGAGSVGRVRINTPTGNFTADSSATQDALTTTGLLKTR